MQLASRIFEAPDIEAAVEFCYQQNWTDGLPVVAPTRGPIERVLAYLERAPDEVVGIIPPRNGIATIEKIAINCVMAGCKPENVPVVIAAVEAMLKERFNLNGVQTTTHACAPLCMVSGPAVKTLGFNTKEGALGHGCRASATIGRAVRLILWNIGGGYPGEPCKTTLGHPGYFSFCVAEDADSNPWEPLQVERGFSAEDTIVTVTATTAPYSVATGSGYSPVEDVLYLLADSIATLGSNNITGGDLVLVLGPMTARNLAGASLTKLQVKQEIMRLAARPVHEVKRRRSISKSARFGARVLEGARKRNTVDAETVEHAPRLQGKHVGAGAQGRRQPRARGDGLRVGRRRGLRVLHLRRRARRNLLCEVGPSNSSLRS